MSLYILSLKANEPLASQCRTPKLMDLSQFFMFDGGLTKERCDAFWERSGSHSVQVKKKRF